MNDKEVYICPECANYGLICVTCTNANKFEPKKKESFVKMVKPDFMKNTEYNVHCVKFKNDELHTMPSFEVLLDARVRPGCHIPDMDFDEIKHTIEFYMNVFPRKSSIKSTVSGRPVSNVPEIKKVIFNPPATIVFWMDNSKTVVKAQNDEPFDPEKGMALAICKKLFGNKGSYFNEIKKWTEPYYEQEKSDFKNFCNMLFKLGGAMNCQSN